MIKSCASAALSAATRLLGVRPRSTVCRSSFVSSSLPPPDPACRLELGVGCAESQLFRLVLERGCGIFRWQLTSSTPSSGSQVKVGDVAMHPTGCKCVFQFGNFGRNVASNGRNT